MIRTILIDDEPAATSLLTMMLQKCSGDVIEIVASCNDPLRGRHLIGQLEPDLVFLDVEMSGLNGIQLLKSFQKPTFQVVFVTAFDKYALEALKLSAIDYLIKPVDLSELITAVEKIKSEWSKQEFDVHLQKKKLENLFSRLENRIGVAMADKILFLHIPEIVFCEANGPYTNIHLENGRKVTASKPLTDFEHQLPASFYRIHHSSLINLVRVKEYQRQDGGYVVMDNGLKLEVSHRKRKDFLNVISNIVV